MTGNIELNEYLRAEREHEARQARIGLRVHAIITALVCAALIIVNIVVAPEFPWSAIVVAGMGIGLGFHFLGVRRVDRATAEKQERITAVVQRRAA
jgi:hypothetical protein